jgi:hypothetical protein
MTCALYQLLFKIHSVVSIIQVNMRMALFQISNEIEEHYEPNSLCLTSASD